MTDKKAKSNGEVGRSLTGVDRINLLNLLPDRGNIQTIRLRRNCVRQLK